MKFLNKNRGITLIALVVTIVILIILATISIYAVFGENGLIRRTEEASMVTKNATQKEKLELAVSGLMIDSIAKNRRDNKSSFRRRVK